MRITTAVACTYRGSTHSLKSSIRIGKPAWLFPAAPQLTHNRKITSAAGALGCRMASTSSNNSSIPTSKIVTKDKIYDEHWQQPEGTPLPKLKVFNSLTRSKVCTRIINVHVYAKDGAEKVHDMVRRLILCLKRANTSHGAFSPMSCQWSVL